MCVCLSLMTQKDFIMKPDASWHDNGLKNTIHLTKWPRGGEGGGGVSALVNLEKNVRIWSYQTLPVLHKYGPTMTDPLHQWLLHTSRTAYLSFLYLIPQAYPATPEQETNFQFRYQWAVETETYIVNTFVLRAISNMLHQRICFLIFSSIQDQRVMTSFFQTGILPNRARSF